MPLRKLELTVSFELTTCCVQDSCSAKLSYVSKTSGAGTRARQGLNAAAFPYERLCPNVYTIHIVKEQTEAQKTPVV